MSSIICFYTTIGHKHVRFPICDTVPVSTCYTTTDLAECNISALDKDRSAIALQRRARQLR